MADDEKAGKNPAAMPTPNPSTIDRTAPAGSEKSLGAKSVRDGRPASDDDVLEAMDEVGPGVDAPEDVSSS